MKRRSVLAGGLLATAGLNLARGASRALPQPDPALWDPQIGPVGESFAEGPNGPVYVRTYGRPGALPLIVLHGGPAAGSRYMRPYAALAAERQVVLYDQSGCGRSAAPTDLKLYSVPRYVEELEAVRAHLGLERVALLGHSWGAFLAPAYADAYPHRVDALVLAGGAPRWRDFDAAANLWLHQLGPEAVETVKQAKATGRTDTPAYGALLQRYYALHLCRLDPWPAWFAAEGETAGANPVYAYLNGPSEFQFTGALADLDVSPALRRARAPILVTCGEFDEAPPYVGRRSAAMTPNARLHVFEGLSHMSHVEDPKTVTGVTGAFLKTVA